MRLSLRTPHAGQLAREPVPGDGRGAYAVLTDAGAATLRRIWPVYETAIAELFAVPVGDGAEELRTTLERVAGHVRGQALDVSATAG